MAGKSVLCILVYTMKREVITTRDGSSTVSVPEMQVTYHSIHGAIQESRHVFIEAGLHYAWEQFPGVPLRVFEMGFGSGLNALLTAMEAEQQQHNIHYVGVEAYPLGAEEVNVLNYGAALQQDALFQQLHQAAWNEPATLTNFFTLEKLETSLSNFSTSHPLHVIYYDAFAPSAQPELWTRDVFEKLYSMLTPGGMLTTYCSKGDVRRAMQAAGFTVTKLQGPRGKREMLRAEKGPLPPEGGT